jgi:hypothetical protein
MPAGKFSPAGRGNRFSPCRLTRLGNDSCRAFFTASFGTGTRNQPAAHISVRPCLPLTSAILTANRTHGAILLVVNGNLIWACCALACDETHGSKKHLEEKACHGVEGLVELVLNRDRPYDGTASLYTKIRSFLSLSSETNTVLFVITLTLQFSQRFVFKPQDVTQSEWCTLGRCDRP